MTQVTDCADKRIPTFLFIIELASWEDWTIRTLNLDNGWFHYVDRSADGLRTKT